MNSRKDTAEAHAKALASKSGSLVYIFGYDGRVAEIWAKEPDIASINLAERKAVTDTGKMCSVTSLLDSEGDETESTSEAVVAVARLDDDNWFSVDLSKFDFGTKAIN